MAKKVIVFKNKERRTRAEVSAFLHQLADKFEAGKVVLRQGAEEVELELPNNLTLEIQVDDKDKKRKGTQHSLEIEIEWYDADAPGGPLELG